MAGRELKMKQHVFPGLVTQGCKELLYVVSDICLPAVFEARRSVQLLSGPSGPCLQVSNTLLW